MTVSERPQEADQIVLRVATMPHNPLVVIKQPTGFLSGQERLDAYEHVTIEIDVIDSVGKAERFVIGRTFSSNAGGYSPKRKDGTWDFGGQLVLWGVKSGTMKFRIRDSKNALNFPLVIEIQKRNEMPF